VPMSPCEIIILPVQLARSIWPVIQIDYMLCTPHVALQLYSVIGLNRVDHRFKISIRVRALVVIYLPWIYRKYKFLMTKILSHVRYLSVHSYH
jgi:hypothetical protein